MAANEFERQVENLIQKGYPALAGLNEHEFQQQLQPLKESANEIEKKVEEPLPGRVPFIIVVNSEWVNVDKAMRLVERKNKLGLV